MACRDNICTIGPAAGVSNTLGFSGPGVESCCSLPCPAFPIHNVLICVRVNSCTTVKIQQGCACPSDDDTDVISCNAEYGFGQSYDSWGRKCRVVSWQRKVPDDAFIRIRFCTKDNCEYRCGCDDGCVSRVGHSHRNGNALLKFEIDNNDARRVVQLVNRYHGDDSNAETGGTYQCIRAACIDRTGGSTGDCCYVSHTGEVNWQIDDIPLGAEIVVGPMSEVFFSIPPTVVYG